MKHRVKTKKFNRDTNNRKALLRNLVRQLVEHGEITTTEAKAKETRKIADKLIGKARDNSLATRRQLHTFFGKRDVVNTLVDRVAPVFAKRDSGFTKITELGSRRGDNTKMVKLELVEKPAVTGSLKNTEKKAVQAGSPKTKVSRVKAPAKQTKKQVAKA